MTNAPTQRQLRVAEEIRHVLAQALQRGELHDPVLDAVPVTVSEVRVSPDLRHATAYVMPLGGLRMDEVLAALEKGTWIFNRMVARAVRLRFTPTLAFAADGSFDEAGRIEAILRRPEVARDLGERSEDGEA